MTPTTLETLDTEALDLTFQSLNHPIAQSPDSSYV